LQALAKNLLEVKSVTLANDALLAQLLWILVTKGMLAKSELIAAIDASATANRRAATPEGQGQRAGLARSPKTNEPVTLRPRLPNSPRSNARSVGR